MNFLFDENMPVRLAKGLEILDADNEFGKTPVNNFYHITDFKEGLSDQAVVKLAKKYKAIIVSQDDDYKNINATSELVKKSQIGYVLFKQPKKSGSSYDEIVSALVSAWPKSKKEISGRKPPFMAIIERKGHIKFNDKFRR